MEIIQYEMNFSLNILVYKSENKKTNFFFTKTRKLVTLLLGIEILSSLTSFIQKFGRNTLNYQQRLHIECMEQYD